MEKLNERWEKQRTEESLSMIFCLVGQNHRLFPFPRAYLTHYRVVWVCMREIWMRTVLDRWWNNTEFWRETEGWGGEEIWEGEGGSMYSIPTFAVVNQLVVGGRKCWRIYICGIIDSLSIVLVNFPVISANFQYLFTVSAPPPISLIHPSLISSSSPSHLPWVSECMYVFISNVLLPTNSTSSHLPSVSSYSKWCLLVSSRPLPFFPSRASLPFLRESLIIVSTSFIWHISRARVLNYPSGRLL